MKIPNPLAGEPEILRYERKFLVTDYSYRDVEQLLKFHPSCFSEIFHERTVNNIYFDTPGFASYYDNVEGSTERQKVRVRWYGKLFGDISGAVLEYKIKSGLLGKKRSFALSPFSLNEHFTHAEIRRALDADRIPVAVRNELLSLRPVLLNSYKRKYFLSADKMFRITIDHDLTYYRINSSGNIFLSKIADKGAVVVELKYDSSLENEAKEVASRLPFAMTKNSKYLQGIELLIN